MLVATNRAEGLALARKRASELYYLLRIDYLYNRQQIGSLLVRDIIKYVVREPSILLSLLRATSSSLVDLLIVNSNSDLVVVSNSKGLLQTYQARILELVLYAIYRLLASIRISRLDIVRDSQLVKELGLEALGEGQDELQILNNKLSNRAQQIAVNNLNISSYLILLIVAYNKDNESIFNEKVIVYTLYYIIMLDTKNLQATRRLATSNIHKDKELAIEGNNLAKLILNTFLIKASIYTQLDELGSKVLLDTNLIEKLLLAIDQELRLRIVKEILARLVVTRIVEEVLLQDQRELATFQSKHNITK